LRRRTLAAGAGYFGAVFAVGFVLGTLRVLWLAPAIGETQAELLEIPLMLVAIVVIARWIVRRYRLAEGIRGRLPTGLIALLLLLAAEILVVIAVRGETIGEYLAHRDPLAGSLYALSLLLFALMPWLAGGRLARARDGEAR